MHPKMLTTKVLNDVIYPNLKKANNIIEYYNSIDRTDIINWQVLDKPNQFIQCNEEMVDKSVNQIKLLMNYY